MGFVIIQEENLAAVKIKGCLVAVKADLGSSLAKIVIRVVIFITSAIKIVEELIVFIKYKASKLEVFGVAVAGKIKKSVKVVRQQ